MESNLLFSLFALFAVFASYATQSPSKSEEALAQVFLDSITSAEDYDPRVPPNGPDGVNSPVDVHVSMYVLDLEKRNFDSTDLYGSFYFRQHWNDSRLAYDVNDAKFKKLLVTDTSKIWTPDLFFTEEKEGKLHHVTKPNIFMRVHPSGNVIYSLRVTVQFSCNMNLRKFPFDSHRCPLSIESYGYTTKDMNLYWVHAEDDFPYNENITMKEFELTSAIPTKQSVSFSSGNYSRLQVTFNLHRKLGFYTLRLYVPFLLLVIVSWLTFWIKPKLHSLRLTLLLAVLYFLVTLGIDVNTYIDPQPYTKASDVWIAVCEALVFAALLEFILVSLLTRKEKSRNKRCDEEVGSGLEIEEKKATVEKTDSMTSSAKFVAKNLLKEKRWSKRIDIISRILFPVLFILFNIIYWASYCTGE